MVLRKKNLLDAFRQAGGPGPRTEGPSTRAEGPSNGAEGIADRGETSVPRIESPPARTSQTGAPSSSHSTFGAVGSAVGGAARSSPGSSGPFSAEVVRPASPFVPQAGPQVASLPSLARRPPDKTPLPRFEPASPPAFLPEPVSRLVSGILSDHRVRVVLLVAAIACLGAYAAGRLGGGSSAEAGAPEREATGPGVLARPGSGAVPLPGGADLAKLNLSTAKMGTEDDRAFMDPANKYTIRLIQYRNDPDGEKKARETAEHLRRKEGLPIVGPIAMGKILILAAGHAPRQEDLDRLLAHVRSVHGPPPHDKKLPFADAYVVNIDDQVKRR